MAEPRSECEEILRCVRVPRDLFAIGRTKVRSARVHRELSVVHQELQLVYSILSI